MRSEESALRHFREESKGVNDVALPRVRRGREHLVDLERGEQIYLVIRDRFLSPAQSSETY